MRSFHFHFPHHHFSSFFILLFIVSVYSNSSSVSLSLSENSLTHTQNSSFLCRLFINQEFFDSSLHSQFLVQLLNCHQLSNYFPTLPNFGQVFDLREQESEIGSKSKPKPGEEKQDLQEPNDEVFDTFDTCCDHSHHNLCLLPSKQWFMS